MLLDIMGILHGMWMMSIMIQLQKEYIMKGVGALRYYLGGDVLELKEYKKEGITHAFSAETYIQNALPKLAAVCGMSEFALRNKCPSILNTMQN